MKTRFAAIAAALFVTASAAADEWTLQPPALQPSGVRPAALQPPTFQPPVFQPTGLQLPPPRPGDPTVVLTSASAVADDRPEAPGQQHWVSLGIVALQPSVGRVQVKVLPRENGSLWLEAYGGGELFNGVYGFGARLEYTSQRLTPADVITVGPGLGVHILPDWFDAEGRGHTPRCRYDTLTYLVGDVDVAWLHDFTPRFGWELGVKVGLAGRLSGKVGRDYPYYIMFGRDLFPVFGIYSGVRF
jgi:hypothetical protein